MVDPPVAPVPVNPAKRALAMVAKHAGIRGRPWRRTRAAILSQSDICHLCGHPGSGDIDHLIPRSLGGDPKDPGNLAPAHGALSRCPVCGLCCNQVKKNRLDLKGTRVGTVVGKDRAW